MVSAWIMTTHARKRKVADHMGMSDLFSFILSSQR
jgi:hypothetical protein